MVNENNVYIFLTKCKDANYNIVSEEYKFINNEEYYYIGINLKYNSSNRIGFYKIKVTNENYKQMAIQGALANAVSIFNIVNNNNKTNNVNNINNSNSTNVTKGNNNSNNINNTNNTNNKNNKNNRFSENTIRAMTKFKQDNNITSNEKLLAYLTQFDPRIKAINQLNEELAIQFLQWANRMVENK